MNPLQAVCFYHLSLYLEKRDSAACSTKTSLALTDKVILICLLGQTEEQKAFNWQVCFCHPAISESIIYSTESLNTFIRPHWSLTSLRLVVRCRYDIRSTETVFDNATRSRIVSPETNNRLFLHHERCRVVILHISCSTSQNLNCAVFCSSQVAEIISRTTCRQTCQTTGEL